MYDQYKQKIESEEKSLVWCWKQVPDFYFERDEEDDKWNEENERYRYRLLLTLDIAEERILWSDYDSWHSPLNDGNILSESEQLEEEQGKVFDETYGWERVFDFDWLIQNEYCFEPIVQGVFDTVKITAIKNIQLYDCKTRKLLSIAEITRLIEKGICKMSKKELNLEVLKNVGKSRTEHQT